MKKIIQISNFSNFLKEALYLLGDEKRKIPFLILMFLSMSILDLIGLGLILPFISLIVNPQSLDENLLKFILSLGVPNKTSYFIVLLSVILFILFLIKSLMGIYINYRIIKFTENQKLVLRSFLMSSYQSMPYLEYLQRANSEYIYNIQIVVENFTSGVLLTSLKIVSDGIVAIVLITFLLWAYGPVFLSLIGILGFAFFLYDKFFRFRLNMYGEMVNNSSDEMIGAIQAGIKSLKEVRVLGREVFFYDRVVEPAEKNSEFHLKSHVTYTAPRFFLELIMVSSLIFLVLYTVISGDDLNQALPMLTVFGIVALRLLPMSNVISTGILQIRFHRDGMLRLYRDVLYLNKLNLADTNDKKLKNNKTFKRISFKNVNFTYKGNNYKTLDNVSFIINSGDVIGITGESGSGKTTLIDIILGLIEIPKANGTIYFNDIEDPGSFESYRNHIAYIPQNIFLFNGSLMSNITLIKSKEQVNMSLFNRSIEQSYLLSVIEKLPNGVETILGDDGIKLSGGQRQRVALARAFYHSRDILVMDEPTSALDKVTENEIVQNLIKNKLNKTLIIASHSLDLINLCDRVFEVKNGKINEITL